MVADGSILEDGKQDQQNISVNGAAQSWATTISGQSVSTSGSVGSPSSRSEQATATPGENTFLRLNHADTHGDDARSQGTTCSRKKRRGQRAVGNDKNGRGLRQFSMKVCEKVESKGKTTYNEVADELVAEFTDPSNHVASPDQQQYDEKNIRRRVYDALNVLMAMDIISKDKKDIQWKGLPRTSLSDIEEMKSERLNLRNRIEKKAAYLKELDEQTRPNATVEVEISEDMQLVHFDFNRRHDRLSLLPPPSDNDNPSLAVPNSELSS